MQLQPLNKLWYPNGLHGFFGYLWRSVGEAETVASEGLGFTDGCGMLDFDCVPGDLCFDLYGVQIPLQRSNHDSSKPLHMSVDG
jgi:hypothetical protein